MTVVYQGYFDRKCRGKPYRINDRLIEKCFTHNADWDSDQTYCNVIRAVIWTELSVKIAINQAVDSMSVVNHDR